MNRKVVEGRCAKQREEVGIFQNVLKGGAVPAALSDEVCQAGLIDTPDESCAVGRRIVRAP